MAGGRTGLVNIFVVRPSEQYAERAEIYSAVSRLFPPSPPSTIIFRPLSDKRYGAWSAVFAIVGSPTATYRRTTAAVTKFSTRFRSRPPCVSKPFYCSTNDVPADRPSNFYDDATRRPPKIRYSERGSERGITRLQGANRGAGEMRCAIRPPRCSRTVPVGRSPFGRRLITTDYATFGRKLTPGRFRETPGGDHDETFRKFDGTRPKQSCTTLSGNVTRYLGELSYRKRFGLWFCSYQRRFIIAKRKMSETTKRNKKRVNAFLR